jgi:hypothetical protein
MKSLIATTILACITVLSVQAQKIPSALSPILSSYYNVKDALVNSDPAMSSAKAGEFLNTINAIDTKTLPATEQNTFASLKIKLVTDAKMLSQTKNIEKQRAFFASLSTNIYTLIKKTKLSGEPIYYTYCPMKKAYWLSNEAAIKNPYYGNQMLTCGKINETLK